MKTRLFILTLLVAVALPQSMHAQYADYYYHRVGDTVEWDTRIGYYSWWEWEYFYQHNLSTWYYFYSDWSDLWESVYDSAIQLQYFYTPVPLKIIGIAASCTRERIEGSAFVQDTNERDEYLYIYEAGPGDTFTQVSATRWSPFDPKRYIFIRAHNHCDVPDSCCGYNPWAFYLPISEYYFDSAIWVTDSFYVGASLFGNIIPSYGGSQHRVNTEYATAVQPGTHRCDPEVQGQIGGPPDYTCTFPYVRIKRRSADISHHPTTSFTNNGWTWISDRKYSVLIYPIIEVDTTVPPQWACDTIANVQVTTSGTSATVTWDGFPNYSSILLRYGKANLPQSQWTEIDVTGNTLYTLTDLQPVSFYSVTLKAECDTSKKETPWSNPVTFYVASDTSGGTEGVDGATLLSQLTFMSPNPAKDEVTVTSSFNLTAIDIWTADGVMVYHGSRTGHDTTLDVSWLRAGTYIVAIHTHNGTTHKRLLIAR